MVNLCKTLDTYDSTIKASKGQQIKKKQNAQQQT